MIDLFNHDMINICLFDISCLVGGFDIVVDEDVGETLNMNVVLISDRIGKNKEIDGRLVVHVAFRHFSVDHREFLPIGHTRSKGGLVHFVGIVTERVDTIIINTVVEVDTRDTGHIVDESPDIEVLCHLRVLILPERACTICTRVPGKPLESPHGGRGLIIAVLCGGKSFPCMINCGVARNRLLYRHIQYSTVVHVSRCERGEEEMPGNLCFGSIRRGLLYFRWAGLANSILRLKHVILCSCDHSPVSLLQCPPILDIKAPCLIEKRPVPVHELRCAEIAVSVHPCPIFNVNDIVVINRVVTQVLLDGGGVVALRGGITHEARYTLHVVGVASTECVVSIVCEENEHGVVFIVVLRNVVDISGIVACITIIPGHGHGCWHHRDGVLLARFGVSMLGLMRGEGEGHRIVGRAAARYRLRKPVVLLRVDLVGGVGRVVVVTSR
mmetsp:Transcript_16776/g.42127  ORF Transcript_16776/g.42127 Transcript_16776/m.42127 type:complete len:441 (+) Transcript_16776:112-1434(+)